MTKSSQLRVTTRSEDRSLRAVRGWEKKEERGVQSGTELFVWTSSKQTERFREFVPEEFCREFVLEDIIE